MGAMKELFTQKQDQYATFKFHCDGCPIEEAAKEGWDSMVERLYDGNQEAAMEEFHLWLNAHTSESIAISMNEAMNMADAQDTEDEIIAQERFGQFEVDPMGRVDPRDCVMGTAESLGMEDEAHFSSKDDCPGI